jgi:hypothetical protein
MQRIFIFFFAGLIMMNENAFAQVERMMTDELPATLFAKGTISTPDDEFGITFTPDEQTCFFAKRTPSTITSSMIVICYSHFENGRWQSPVIAPFSGKYKDFDPFISPDGSKLFFISNRPSSTKRTRDTDIWFVQKKDSGWGEPVNIDTPVNTPGWELGCSVSTNGNLYFSAVRENGKVHIYYATYKDGKYEAPVKLDSCINSDVDESDPFIAPDESYLIFSSTGRGDALHGGGADSYPRSDLYISFKINGKWMPAKHLHENINSIAEESNPYVSPKSHLLFFTSERNFIVYPMKKKMTYAFIENHLHSIENGLGNIYTIPFESIAHP